MLFSVPVSLMFGITGIIFDKGKWLAVTTTVLSAGYIVFIVCMIVISIIRTT